ncbi:MAG: hypothetical protein WD648_05240 [Planctomycetaceae bacterium]
MGLRSTALAVALAMTLASSGCSTVESPGEVSRKSAGLDKPEHPKGYSWNKDEDDPYGFVGKESGRAMEKDPDPWFKQLFYSGKARNIERNLGLD